MAKDLPASAQKTKEGEFDSQCEHWLREMAAGNEQALNSLYDATLAKVYAVAKRIIGEPSAAEDIVTDVYWQAWTNASQYEPERGRPVTWLLTICRSRAIDEYRRQAAARRSIDAARAAEELPLAEEPDDMLQATDDEHAVHALLKKMEPGQRQLIALAFFKDFSHQQIADCTGLPLGTVKTTVRRALLKLRDALSETEVQFQS